jgi:hypothetical protein
MPLRGSVVAVVPCGFLPVWYASDWDGSFIPKTPSLEPVTLENLEESEVFCDVRDVSYLTGVYIFVSVKELADFGVKMEDSPGIGWNEYDVEFFEDEQPTPTSVWNYGRKCWDEPCDNERCICRGNKLKIDWCCWDTNFPSILENDYFSFGSFFDTDLGGLYCRETCQCNGCNKYYNPTNDHSKNRHALLDPEGWSRGCSQPGDSSDLYKY